IHGGRAQSLEKLGRHAEALAAYDAALKYDPGPRRAILRAGRAITLIHLGDYARAAAEAGELARLKLPPDACYDLACVWSLCIPAAKKDAKLTPADRDRLTEEYAARAVELLRQARAGGFFRPAENVDLLKQDPDLDPVRSRDDFKAFVGEVEGKTKTPPPGK